MILKNVQSPLKALYIIGGRVLLVLKEDEFGAISPLGLHGKYNELFEEISFAYLSYALDWLYLVECIKLTDQGDVQLCN
jgi:hypothetical protein